MRGRLLSLLRAARGAINGLQTNSTPRQSPIMSISPKILTGFAFDIAKGMEYIADSQAILRGHFANEPEWEEYR